MAVFPSNPFRPSNSSNRATTLVERVGTRYRSTLPRHPFLLFGLPFIAIMVAGSFVLTPATALRYERHDRRVRQLSQEEAMGLGLGGKDGKEREGKGRVVGSEKEEYYRLMAKDLDNWEQKRVQRWKGEPDGRL